MGIPVDRVFDRRAIERRRLLGDVSDAPVAGKIDFPLVGMQLAAQQREQAGLTGAVGAGEADALAGIDRCVRALEERLDAPYEGEIGETDQAASRSARRRSCSLRWRLRRRMDFGVISTSSSSPMNSTAYSSVSPIGGVSRMASSLPLARMLVSCLVRIGLTTRSLSRLWMPTIMPSYTGSPGLTNMRPRSCSFHSA